MKNISSYLFIVFISLLVVLAGCTLGLKSSGEITPTVITEDATKEIPKPAETHAVETNTAETKTTEVNNEEQNNETKKESKPKVPPKLGSLSVSSTPSDATVYVDNKDKGETPVTIDDLLVGSHTITISKSGYYDSTVKVTIEENKTESLSVELTKSESTYATLAISSNVDDVTVYLNNIEKGETDGKKMNITSLTPGNYSVKIAKESYFDYETTVLLSSGATKTLNVDMNPIYNLLSQGEATDIECDVESVCVNNLLTFAISPDDSKVYVDNVLVENWARVMNLSTGMHSVRATADGYEPSTHTFSIRADDTIHLNFSLIRYGFLSLKTNPGSCDVDISGTDYTTDSDGELELNLTAGTYNITASKQHYYDEASTFTITAGQTTSKTLTLDQSTGTLYVTSSPTGANITVDGTNYGLAPITVDYLSPGTHNLSATLVNYNNYATTVSVTAGRTTSKSATMVHS